MNTEESKPGAIHQAISTIMAEVGGVAKGRKNTGQGYDFRGIADLYLACQPVMAKNGVHILPFHVIEEHASERETKNGGAMFHIRQRIEFRLYHSDGSWVRCETTGEAMDSGDKASNKCMSAAMKYALIQLFAIPEADPTIDTENESPEVKSAAPTKAAAPAAKPAARPKVNPNVVSAIRRALDKLFGPVPDDGPGIEEQVSMRAALLESACGRKVDGLKDLWDDEKDRVMDAIDAEAILRRVAQGAA